MSDLQNLDESILDHTIITRSLPMPVEKEISESDLHNYKFFYSKEGTLLRIYFDDNMWKILTQKKDAFDSRWGSKKTMADLLIEGIDHEYLTNPKFQALIMDSTPDASLNTFDQFLNCLDKTKIYLILLLCDRTRRVVCSPFIGSPLLNIGCLQPDNPFLIVDNEIPFENQQKYVSIDSSSTLQKLVADCDYTKVRGISAIGNGEIIHFFHPMYKQYLQARGNCPHLLDRYIEIKHRNPNYEHCRLLNELYPYMKERFDEIDEKLAELIHSLKKCWKDRQTRYVFTTPKRNYILKKIKSGTFQEIKKEVCKECTQEIQKMLMVTY